jgi:Zn-dependent protease
MIVKPITIGRVFDIPVKISWTWFPIFAIHVAAVAVFYLPRHLYHRPLIEYWVLGFVATVLLFLSILGHELGHALFARAEGLHLHDITLHLFGGLTRFDREVTTPLAEFKIGVAGPAANFIYAVLFFLLNQLSIYVIPNLPAAILTNYLALCNLILAIFNLLPGFPLDGGRMLRAWLWHRWKDLARATRWTTRAGEGIAYFMIGCGAYWILTSKSGADIFAGTWSILTGIFLKDMTGASQGDLRPPRNGEGLRVADIMTEPVAISPDLTIEHLINDVLPTHRQTTFPVSAHRRLHGIVSLERLKSVPQEQWRTLTARDVMVPVNDKLFILAESSLHEAQQVLMENQIGYAGVIDSDGYLVGYIGLIGVRKSLSQGA